MPAKSKKAGHAASIPSNPPPHSTNPAQPDPELAPPITGHTGSQQASGPMTMKENEAKILAGKNSDSSAQPAVNRKKQKRREKEAAKRAAEQRAGSESMARGGYIPNAQSLARSYFREETDDFNNYGYGDGAGEADEAFFSGAEDSVGQGNVLGNGFEQIDHITNDQAGKKKKKAKNVGQLPSFPHSHRGNSASTIRNPDPLLESHLPPTSSFSTAALRSAHENFAHDQIWNTSTQAERENIKLFWLELGEEERRSLVKVEKEAVLRKMKEQQKHSCSCTVCGRKRTAIEEELEVLYDAYYQELEQFANHNNHLPNGTAAMSDPRSYAHLRTRRHPMAGQFPVERNRHDLIEDDEDLDDDEFDEDEEPYSDDEIEEIPRAPPDFFTFGNSLTVKDGILTVADDLLVNNGKHFIDMMESLAEKRMQRKQGSRPPFTASAYQSVHQGHNHPPLDEEDDYDDDEDDEDYDSQEEDELEADEMSAMTEEQRMEEGRRMFQIFAARMFEQRVLTAYREKVARERQRKLIEELEEENRIDTQKEAKKAREAARKKEKKKVQKQAKDEEKAKKEAEKATQEAAIRAAEEEKLEEQRQRKEEQRKKREGEKKAADEERRRKEAEKQKKAQEERERQQELERKQREVKENEKKKREEARKREREEKAAKEREMRERKAKEVADRTAAEDQVRKEKEAAAKVDKEAKDRSRQDEQARQSAKRTRVAIPPGIHPTHPSILQSPQFQVATPIMPAKAATSARPRQQSHQGPPSHGSSPRSQQAAPTETTLSSTPSSTSIAQPNASAAINVPGKQNSQVPPLHHPQPSAPLSPLSNQTRSGQPPYGYNGMPGPAANGPAATTGLGMMPSMMPQMPMYHGPPMGGPHRAYGPPNGIPFPPGMNGNRHLAQAAQSHFPLQSGGIPGAHVAPPNQPVKFQVHSRQPSASQERVPDSVGQPTPISRPVPVAQCSNSIPNKKENRETSDPQVEQLATQLGSKALLDDSDIPLSAVNADPISAPGAPGSGRTLAHHFSDPKHDAFQPGNWGAFSPTGAFTGPPTWTAAGLTPKPGGGWPTPHHSSANAFGIIGAGAHAPHRPHAPRPVTIRLMVAEACKKLSATPGTASDGFHPAPFLLRQVEQMKPPHEPVISLNEMLEICETEGNPQNGGGGFSLGTDGFQGQTIKFEPLAGPNSNNLVGDIGSPIPGQAQPAAKGGIGQLVSGTHKGH